MVVDTLETEVSLAIVVLDVCNVISVETIEEELSKVITVSSVVLENLPEVVLRVLV